MNRSGSCRKEKWLTAGCRSSPASGIWSAINKVFSRLIRLVVVSVNDPSRDLDAPQLFRSKVRLRRPHLADLLRNDLYWSGVGESFSYSFSARAI